MKNTTSYKTTSEQLLKFVGTDRDASDHLGRSVAVSTDSARVAVGAYMDGSHRGSAYVLDDTAG